MRTLQYNANGELLFKLRFGEEWTVLPQCNVSKPTLSLQIENPEFVNLTNLNVNHIKEQMENVKIHLREIQEPKLLHVGISPWVIVIYIIIICLFVYFGVRYYHNKKIKTRTSPPEK